MGKCSIIKFNPSKDILKHHIPSKYHFFAESLSSLQPDRKNCVPNIVLIAYKYQSKFKLNHFNKATNLKTSLYIIKQLPSVISSPFAMKEPHLIYAIVAISFLVLYYCIVTCIKGCTYIN